MPISAFLFGGRRASTIPLVNEAFDWEHGVFMGSAAGSETTAANLSKTGRAAARPLRHAALLRLQHGRLLRPLAVDGRSAPTRRSCRRVFFVNWFRKDEDGHFLWPGYGENSRVLKWIFERVEGGGDAVRDAHRLPARPRRPSTFPGWMSRPTDMSTLLSVDREGWKQEADGLSKYYDEFGDRLPAASASSSLLCKERLGGRERCGMNPLGG